MGNKTPIRDNKKDHHEKRYKWEKERVRGENRLINGNKEGGDRWRLAEFRVGSVPAVLLVHLSEGFERALSSR